MLFYDPSYMTENQVAHLSKPISEQTNGIVLIWGGYASGAITNTDFRCTFIPKQYIQLFSGSGVFEVMGSGAGIQGFKYVYIDDNSIYGSTYNYGGNNKNYVLIAVIGI